MPTIRKRVTRKSKNLGLEDWQIDFLKNGPPGDFDDWRDSPHRWTYLGGRDLWEKVKASGADIKDFPWGVWAYESK